MYIPMLVCIHNYSCVHAKAYMCPCMPMWEHICIQASVSPLNQAFRKAWDAELTQITVSAQIGDVSEKLMGIEVSFP